MKPGDVIVDKYAYPDMGDCIIGLIVSRKGGTFTTAWTDGDIVDFEVSYIKEYFKVIA